MSILIKGMEMPKSCEDCMLESYCGLWVLLKDRPARHPDCPLIELPPHGRLGELDKLIDRLNGLCELNCQYSKKQREVMCGACMLGLAFDVIDDAPTILEAQEDET